MDLPEGGCDSRRRCRKGGGTSAARGVDGRTRGEGSQVGVSRVRRRKAHSEGFGLVRNCGKDEAWVCEVRANRRRGITGADGLEVWANIRPRRKHQSDGV